MEAVYNWSIEKILAKPVFTDKHGNTRENVIKMVTLRYTGELGNRKTYEEKNVRLSLIDLTNFKSHEELTKEQVLEWALSSLSAVEKDRMESLVKIKIEQIEVQSEMVEISL